jgi:tRNA(adenine34) deaminase
MSWTENDKLWMSLALQQAEVAFKKDEVPVGAVVVDSKNQLVSMAYNLREKLNSPLGHAELLALHMASKKLNSWRLIGCRLYVTLEPCAMCAGALIQSRVEEVIYSTADPKGGALNSLYQLGEDRRLNHQFQSRSGLFAEDSQKLLKDFFKLKRQNKKS